MRAAIMALIGTILISPSISIRLERALSKNVKRRQNHLDTLKNGLKNIYGVVIGKDHVRPANISLVSAMFILTLLLWLLGTPFWWALTISSIGIVAILLKWLKTKSKRSDQLDEFWPSYLDRTRSKIISSSRALPYIFFDQEFIGSTFEDELLRPGRREFENSGDIQKAIVAIWKNADHNITNLVCSSLYDIRGATTSQVETHLNTIAETIRAHNSLDNEARAKLAGVRTTRAFILIIPIGMALVGLSFAGSIKPFLLPSSIVQEAFAASVLIGCWLWSSNLMKFPSWPVRKFDKQMEESK